MSVVPIRSLRFGGKSAQTLNNITGSSGEIFYDSTNQTLRVYPGRQISGQILATRAWSQTQQGLLPNLNATQIAALSATNGQLVYNTTTNKIQGYQNGSWINLDGTA